MRGIGGALRHRCRLYATDAVTKDVAASATSELPCPLLTELSFYLEDASLPARRQSQQLFDWLQRHNRATLAHFHTMLHWCDTASSARTLIERELSLAGIEPTAETYALLAQAYAIEGDLLGARRVLLHDLPNAGLSEDEHIRKVRSALDALDDATLDRLRTAG